MCLLATRKPHFCISESCISNQTPNTFTHSEPWERVLAGSVVQTELLFRTTELSNIYCLVKVSVRNYDISRQHRSSSAKGGDFPLSPQTGAVWAWSTYSSIQEDCMDCWWRVCLWLILFETPAIKKNVWLKRAFESYTDIFGLKQLMFCALQEFYSWDWWNIH